MADVWPEDEYDYDATPDEDCLCEEADINTVEGRGHCPHCGRAWWLSTAEIQAELRFVAEYAGGQDPSVSPGGE